jgi:hypothetical protein
MNYLILLTEMAIDHDVELGTTSNGQWRCLVDERGTAKDTPEEAIRAAYLALNPIEPNTRTGSLKQTD